MLWKKGTRRNRWDTLFIQTAEKYPRDGGALIDYATQEQDEDTRPELTSHIENPADYDTFFRIGGFSHCFHKIKRESFLLFDQLCWIQ